MAFNFNKLKKILGIKPSQQELTSTSEEIIKPKQITDQTTKILNYILLFLKIKQDQNNIYVNPNNKKDINKQNVNISFSQSIEDMNKLINSMMLSKDYNTFCTTLTIYYNKNDIQMLYYTVINYIKGFVKITNFSIYYAFAILFTQVFYFYNYIKISKNTEITFQNDFIIESLISICVYLFNANLLSYKLECKYDYLDIKILSPYCQILFAVLTIHNHVSTYRSIFDVQMINNILKQNFLIENINLQTFFDLKTICCPKKQSLQIHYLFVEFNSFFDLISFTTNKKYIYTCTCCKQYQGNCSKNISLFIVQLKGLLVLNVNYYCEEHSKNLYLQSSGKGLSGKYIIPFKIDDTKKITFLNSEFYINHNDLPSSSINFNHDPIRFSNKLPESNTPIQNLLNKYKDNCKGNEILCNYFLLYLTFVLNMFLNIPIVYFDNGRYMQSISSDLEIITINFCKIFNNMGNVDNTILQSLLITIINKLNILKTKNITYKTNHPNYACTKDIINEIIELYFIAFLNILANFTVK